VKEEAFSMNYNFFLLFLVILAILDSYPDPESEYGSTDRI